MTTTTATSKVATRLVDAFAAQDAKSALAATKIPRRELFADDVQLDILFCGVCHSDLHQVRDEWKFSIYPIVPGHEIVGRVSAVGSAVKKFKVGDMAAIGTMVDSCGVCPSCKEDYPQYCDAGNVQTYNSQDKHTGTPTFGGYSESIVAKESFVLHVPEGLDPAATAPLLCAGITTYSPLKHWKVGAGHKVGVVGLGGLGHMGVKFARAMGAHVVLFTTSPGKIEDGKRLGAHEVVLSKNPDEMAKHVNTFDFILDCVSADHDLNAYLKLLKRDGTLTIVGAPENPQAVSMFSLIPGRKSLAGSCVGGIGETQEMLEFCAKHNIVSEIEMIDIADINTAYERLLKQDVKYRFVIDLKSLKK
ncbi:MAG: NAD(P)-dependent alcohol dehydrogenase [Cyanobacteria bacterium REEB67]|nr:NAD(P)-dependent alcohol dehydrogenase [Cyanobacteria bacterium REEB67]